MAGQISRTGFGLSDKARMDRAVGLVIRAIDEQRCNCLGDNRGRTQSISWDSLSPSAPHARHIQQSRGFHPLPRSLRKTSGERSRAIHTEALQAWENEGGFGLEAIPAA